MGFDFDKYAKDSKDAHRFPDIFDTKTNETEVIAECKDLSCDSDKKLFNRLEEDNLECKIILNNN